MMNSHKNNIKSLNLRECSIHNPEEIKVWQRFRFVLLLNIYFVWRKMNEKFIKNEIKSSKTKTKIRKKNEK